MYLRVEYRQCCNLSVTRLSKILDYEKWRKWCNFCLHRNRTRIVTRLKFRFTKNALTFFKFCASLCYLEKSKELGTVRIEWSHLYMLSVTDPENRKTWLNYPDCALSNIAYINEVVNEWGFSAVLGGSTIDLSMALQPFVGPWTLFKFLDLLHHRQDSLDGGSARRKAATCTQDSTNTK
jgi:hypothetical protein